MAKFNKNLSDEIRMSDSIDLSEYFPSGSTTSNKIKLQIESQLKDGSLKLGEPALTLDEHKKLLEEQKKRDWQIAGIGYVIAIISIIVNVVLWLMK